MIKNLVDLKENIELDSVEIFITDCAPFQVKKTCNWIQGLEQVDCVFFN